ncbi:hypothetical protein LTR08_002607 [Meristemomyces frigidus]|nr:hypothetical protein LTR08_002607 [Meristemomyces frigidus]
MSSTDTLSARCIATTGDSFCKTIDECASAWSFRSHHRGRDAGDESNFFQEARFSGDGTTIVTHSADQCLRTFVLPNDLLDESKQPHALGAHSTGSSPSNLQAYDLYPSFTLQDPSTTLVLSASVDQPITLRNVLDYSTVHAKYQHAHKTTEAYIRSNSLAFTRDGRHFIAGSKNALSIFDCTRDTSGPSSVRLTSASRKAQKLYGAMSMGCKGIVSALSISHDGILAAGTTQREIALYGNDGRGECVTAFATADPHAGRSEPGSGITGLKWSPCARYLMIAERQCDSIQVYDVRKTMQRVSRLTGRKADTTQKLGMDVVPTANGYEIWAGGLDGSVRMWSNPGSKDGAHTPDAGMRLHDDPVTSAIWHPSAAVLATCSGQRFPDTEVEDRPLSGSESDSESDGGKQVTLYPEQRSMPDNKLEIWLA